MSVIKGFMFGLFVGFAAGTAMSERQRREAAERVATIARRRTRPITESVTDNVSQVADTATDVAIERIDEAGDAVSEQVASAGSTPSS